MLRIDFENHLIAGHARQDVETARNILELRVIHHRRAARVAIHRAPGIRHGLPGADESRIAFQHLHFLHIGAVFDMAGGGDLGASAVMVAADLDPRIRCAWCLRKGNASMFPARCAVYAALARQRIARGILPHGNHQAFGHGIDLREHALDLR